MKFKWMALALVAATLATSGCKLEELRDRFDFSDDEEDEDKADDDLGIDTTAAACALAETFLIEDLPLPSETAENQYDALSFVDWCLDNIGRDDLEDYVGNANAWEANEDDPLITATSFTGRATRPYPAHGASLDLHVLRAEGTLPFARKIHFADWQGGAGVCALEMRVYQQNIGESGKRPLLYFHGGGWRNRTTTLTAAEVLVSHLVESHVVFMPSYPLVRDRDGPQECRNASFEDILQSAQQAFDWVQQNMATFGVGEGSPIDLMGHSAGGQLAAWVATRNPLETGRFVNFYGPTEFAEFIDEAKEGGRYADGYEFSKRSIAYLFDVTDINELERPYDELVMQNSLSEIVAEQGVGAVPPFLFVQGNADATVPVEQALTSCNAIGGEAMAAGGDYSCGNNGSRVIIVEGADHNLDRRCVTGVYPEEAEEPGHDLDNYCPTNPADKAAVRKAVRSAYEWLRAE